MPKLKNTLKTIKLNEPTISTVLGVLVVLAAIVLLVNYFKTKSEPQLTLPPAAQTENKQVTPETHKVVKGESLWKIAEKYYNSGYNWVDISKANNLKNASVISEGQELTIPKVDVKKTTIAQTETSPIVQPNAPPVQNVEQSIYKVQKGDSLWKIAIKTYNNGYQWTKIAKENKLRNPNLIYPEQELKLPQIK